CPYCFLINAFNPKLCADVAGGGAIIAWQETDNSCGYGYESLVIALRAPPTGLSSPGGSTLDYSSDPDPAHASICTDGWGGAYVAWQGGAAGAEHILEEWMTNTGAVSPLIPPPSAVNDLIVTDCSMSS